MNNKLFKIILKCMSIIRIMRILISLIQLTINLIIVSGKLSRNSYEIVRIRLTAIIPSPYKLLYKHNYYNKLFV